LPLANAKRLRFALVATLVEATTGFEQPTLPPGGLDGRDAWHNFYTTVAMISNPLVKLGHHTQLRADVTERSSLL
jgi:hypothetical protein